jgi:hypothetical protein
MWHNNVADVNKSIILKTEDCKIALSYAQGCFLFGEVTADHTIHISMLRPHSFSEFHFISSRYLLSPSYPSNLQTSHIRHSVSC